MSQTSLKTDDLDLQGHIDLDTKKICVIPCKFVNVTTFEPQEFYHQTSAVY